MWRTNRQSSRARITSVGLVLLYLIAADRSLAALPPGILPDEVRAAHSPVAPLDPAPTEAPVADRDARLQPASRTEDVVDKAPVLDENSALRQRGKNAPANIETASLGGVAPGKTSLAALKEAWGEPKQSQTLDGRLHLVFAVGPYNHVIATVEEDQTTALLIQLKPAEPIHVVEKKLGLEHLRGVDVADAQGSQLGIAYPERGVALTLESAEKQDVALVLIEPVRAQAFALRAESDLFGPMVSNLADLDTAIRLAPKHARAYWLRAQLLTATGQYRQAIRSIEAAIQLAPGDGNYRLTKADILARQGRTAEAITNVRAIAVADGVTPLVQAKAYTQLGKLLATPRYAKYRESIQYLTKAIQTADGLSVSQDAAVRREATLLLVDAHLAVAWNVAAGKFQDKGKAVLNWLMRARQYADLAVEKEGGDRQLRFQVAAAALRCAVPLEGQVDPVRLVASLRKAGDPLIAAADDPLRKSWLSWQLGMALSDALAIEHQRGEAKKALATGAEAATLFARCEDSHQWLPETQYRLGRIYFRTGAIHAVYNEDHETAALIYRKAIPLLKLAQPQFAEADPGHLGDAFVSIGVSYWQQEKQQEAVQLTERGLKLLQTAVKSRQREPSALGVAYTNLATMHDKLGDQDQAKRYAALANQNKQTTRQ